MQKLIVCALTGFLAVTSTAGPVAAGIVIEEDNVHALQVAHLRQLSLDDGRRAWIGADRRLYIIGAGGASTPAPAGRYVLAGGAAVSVGPNATLDPVSFNALTAHIQTAR